MQVLNNYLLLQSAYRRLVAKIANKLDSTIDDTAYVALAHKLETKAYTADGDLLDDLEGEYRELAEHIQTYP